MKVLDAIKITDLVEPASGNDQYYIKMYEDMPHWYWKKSNKKSSRLDAWQIVNMEVIPYHPKPKCPACKLREEFVEPFSIVNESLIHLLHKDCSCKED